MKKGFTLIELLVVVLIIGILSAVALPQYTKAVRKSRLAEARVILRTLVNAEDLYILSTGGTDWTSWDDLDITVPTETKNWTFDQEECIGNGNKIGCGVFAVSKSEPHYQIEYWSMNYDGGPTMNPLAGKLFCVPFNATGTEICKGLGKYDASSDRYVIEP